MAKRYRPAISYRLREIPLKSVKVWKDAQARKLDRKGVTELARSIKTEGLQNPPMVQKEGLLKEVLLSHNLWKVSCSNCQKNTRLQ